MSQTRWLLFEVIVGLAALVAGPAAAQEWGGLTVPSSAPATVIGGYAGGCIGGAEALPLDGTGYQVMRVSRNRYYGHPELLHFIQTLAADLAAAGHPGVLIGDLAQPRGGPMNSGHRSHQIGLDVDIWFLTLPAGGVSSGGRETLGAPSMVDPGGITVNGNWTEMQQLELRTAASAPEVNRIFVNPAIKQHLCDTETGDRSWLGKIRPWWGHDAHFHVRLTCPSDQPLCEPQPPLPAGEGCDDSLAWWFSAEAKAEATKPAKPPARAQTLDDLPPACRDVFFGG